MDIKFIYNDTFTNNFYYYCFVIAFSVFVLSEIFIYWKSRKNSIGKYKGDRGSLYLIVFGVWFIISMNFYWTIINKLLPEYVELVGIFMILVGIFIRNYSVHLLSKGFTLSVYVGKNQKVIKRGLYKYIRHPAYLGGIISIIGITVTFRNIFNIFFSILVLIIIYGYRIKVEEEALVRNLGKEYIKYKDETKIIFPKIL